MLVYNIILKLLYISVLSYNLVGYIYLELHILNIFRKLYIILYIISILALSHCEFHLTYDLKIMKLSRPVRSEIDCDFSCQSIT